MSMFLHRSVRWLVGVVVGFTSMVHAAKVDPPTVALNRVTTSVVVADFVERGPFQRLVFKRVGVVRSAMDVPDLIDIAEPDLRAPLVAGKRYILAYTAFAPDKRRRVAALARGAVFLSSPGLEPALWEDNPANRALVNWKIDDDPRRARAELPTLFRLLRNGDAQQRDFAAAELTYRPELLRTLSPAEQKHLTRFVESGAGPDRARAELLGMAMAMGTTPAARRQWDSVATTLLAKLPVRIRSQSGTNQLVIACLHHLSSAAAKVEPRVLSRWLASDDINTVELAAAELFRQSPATATQMLERTLHQRDLPDDSRQWLQDRLKRNDGSHPGKGRK